MKNYLFLVLAIVLFTGINSYSQDGISDEGTKVEKTKRSEDGMVNDTEDSPVYVQDSDGKVVSPQETSGTEVKVKIDEELEQKIKEEKGNSTEVIENEEKPETEADVERLKERRKKMKEEERGKSETKGNRDKNNDSPYDHDQGKGNDWKVEGGGKYKDSNSDTRIDNKDKKYDDNTAPDGVKKEKKEKKEKKNKKAKSNKKK